MPNSLSPLRRFAGGGLAKALGHLRPQMFVKGDFSPAGGGTRARAMEKAGSTPREIWAETLHWKAPGVKDYITEISDKDVKIKPRRGAPVDRQIVHPELYQIQGTDLVDAAELSVWPRSGKGTGAGQWVPETKTLTAIGGSPSDLKRVALHEMQHAVEDANVWPTGTHPTTPVQFQLGLVPKGTKDLPDAEWEKMLQEQVWPKYEMWVDATFNGPQLPARQAYAKEFNDDAREAVYRRSAGEAMARATEARRNMTMDQRRAKFPEDSYDVPLDELIIRYLDADGKKDGGPVKMAGGGLASVGAKLSKKALEKGFHTVGYHGTRVDKLIDDILKGDTNVHSTYDRMLGPHIAKDPRVTDAFTVGEYAKNTNPAWLYKGDPRALWDEGGNQILEGGNVVPVALRGKYKKVKGDSQWGELRDQIVEGIGSSEDLFSNWFSKVRQVPIEESSKIYRAFGKGDPVVLGRGDLLMGLDDLVKMSSRDEAIAPHRFRLKGDIFNTDLAGYDTPGQIMRNYDAYGYGLTGKEKRDLVEAYRDKLKREGFSGVEYQNESVNEVRGGVDPTTFIVSDPDAIRSLFARFRDSGAGLGFKRGGLAQCACDRR